MKNPFEAPKQEAPKDDESVDIDVSEFEEPVKGGTREFSEGEIAARHEEEGRKLEAERAAEGSALNAVAEAFFKDNVLLKKRFENDPEAKSRLKEGLMQLMTLKTRQYQLDAEHLVSDARFLKDLLVFSMKFEDEENARRASGRRAA